MTRFTVRLIALVAVGLFVGARPALAGPPLLCHPFDIGSAQSLPWEGRDSWWHGRADYQLTRLVADTTGLLTASTPVVVRMETLRRAALYASQDAQVASQLLAALKGRVTEAERGPAPAAAIALALFDAGYLTETYRQIGELGQMGNFGTRIKVIAAVLGNADGRGMVNRSVSLRPEDPAIRFGAALVMASTDRAAYRAHAAKARQGAAQDALLARNINLLS